MREDYGLQSPHYEAVANKTKQNMGRLPAYLYYHHGHSNDLRPNDIRPNYIRSNDIRSNDIRPNYIRSNDIRPNDIRSNDLRSNDLRVSPVVHTCRSENKFRNRFDI